MDLYLKFTDEAEAASVLCTLHPEVVGEDGITITEAYTTLNYQNIDTLGVIYKQPPEGAGEDYVPVAEEGWHVNVRVVGDEDPAPLEQYAVTPNAPVRVWA